MSQRSAPDRLLRELGRVAIPVESSEQHEQLRERVARSVDTTVRQEQERRGRVAWWRGRAVGLAVAAAVVLLPLGWWQWHSRAATTASQGEAVAQSVRLHALAGAVSVDQGSHGVRAVAGETAVGAGDRIVTGGDGRARLVLARGAEARLASQTVVALPGVGTRQGEQVDLNAGRVEFAVPTLQQGHRFQVLTPHALVAVRGTRFVVAVRRAQPGAALVTTVQVSEGVVAVTRAGRTTLVRAGEAWASSAGGQSSHAEASASEQDEPAATGRAAGPSDGSEAVERQRGAIGARGVAGATAAEQRTSTLGKETRVFEQAMAQQRSGNYEVALGQFERFLVRYPGSPLAHNARVQRFRLLNRLGRKQAAAIAARQYMAEHPRGFARQEARDLVLAPAVPAANAGP